MEHSVMRSVCGECYRLACVEYMDMVRACAIRNNESGIVINTEVAHAVDSHTTTENDKTTISVWWGENKSLAFQSSPAA